MIARGASGLLGAGCLAGAFALAPPSFAALREFGLWLLRPAALPFAWRDLERAAADGDAAETFGRAQQILHLLPSWTDAQVVFAFRFATDDGNARTGDSAARARAAGERMQVALAWLESARASAGRREPELLEAMAMLPEVLVQQYPGLRPELAAAGGAAGYADRYLAEAERISGSPAVREQRTYLTPMVAAGLLAAGRRQDAIAVLTTGIARAADARDRETATEWAARLDEVRRSLRGEAVDLGAVRADVRMAPLLPYLR
ncbi:MAG: hypothetical protein KDE27_18940 [Planctomycetes bacterium]|nr:hypothetical protein [Planctomycetota bacterium]